MPGWAGGHGPVQAAALEGGNEAGQRVGHEGQRGGRFHLIQKYNLLVT